MGDVAIFSDYSTRNHTAALEVMAISTKHGYLDKKNNSFLSWLLPWIFPPYKRRLFILAGGFLFKYKDENSSSPKGIPLPLSACFVERDDEDDCLFEIATIRKRYIIRTSSYEECTEWVHAIKARKLESVKEEMGHTSVSSSTKSLNNSAAALYNEKINAESRTEAVTLNPMLA